MQRRGITVMVGAIVVVLLSLGVLSAPVPYVVLDPGETVDTLGERDDAPVIEISGIETSQSTGQLRLTTVGVRPDVDLLRVLRAWLRSDEAVVPRELIYPPGQSQEEIEERNRQQFTRSQSTAETAALRHLGYPVLVTIAEVVDGAPADGALQAGDIITSVDGQKVDSAVTLQELVTAQSPGHTLTFELQRDGAPHTVEIVPVPDAEDGQTPRIGVLLAEETDAPFDITVQVDRIGGPSAGLMFALGIIDKLVPTDLTGGAIIAGTGSIDEQGNVGAIGGLPQKLVASREVGAAAFLVPANNCGEALRNAQPGLTMIRVETLAGALDELEAFREGRPTTSC